MPWNNNVLKKRDFPTSALRVARKRAQSEADSRNEPIYLMESDREYFVSTDTDWCYRDSRGAKDWPQWARINSEELVIETFFPIDYLKGHTRKANNLVNKMLKMSQDFQFELRFDLDHLCRDYGQVRSQLQQVESGAKHLNTLLIHLQGDVRKAVRDHKKNGKPNGGEPSGPVVSPLSPT